MLTQLMYGCDPKGFGDFGKLGAFIDIYNALGSTMLNG